MLVTDSIVWGNLADDGSQIAMTSGLYFAKATVTNSDVQGGQTQVYTSGEPDNLTWGAGNIDNDPIFVSGPAGYYGDYYLS
ncbi:MAG: hypothetical protein JRC86_09470, partial [Deltaproteobacteria bacterium]|nr:hypothetical protein [Deltaproteobacteria bacterium]